MASDLANTAIAATLDAGHALLKFISANDAGLTGSHQSGFYLPKSAWSLYTPQPPVDGENHKHPVVVRWDDGTVTESMVTWYGISTRSEFRLTRFGRGFQYLRPDRMGSLLVLVPRSVDRFDGFVIDHDDDIEEVMAALGVEPWRGWAEYSAGSVTVPLDDCMSGIFHREALGQDTWPSPAFMSSTTWDALETCDPAFGARSADDQLLEAVRREYDFYLMVQERLVLPLLARPFATVEEFLGAAQSVLQRRKARAGLSFENHIASVLRLRGVPFEAQPASVDGKPDFVIPSASAYHDPDFPELALFVLGAKTTCKDRWRQVIQEGRRVPVKHLLTMQPSISPAQLNEMSMARVNLVVPQPLHGGYPGGCEPQSVEGFVSLVKGRLDKYGVTA